MPWEENAMTTFANALGWSATISLVLAGSPVFAASDEDNPHPT